MSLQPGQIVGQYKIQERVGSGGMAFVYRAEHLTLGRTVAVKIMHAGFADDPDLMARFRREARVVAQLEHPNIVPIFDFNEADGQPYLVMKFIQGRTLKWHMRKRALSLAEIDTICTAVAAALTYAHAQGVLHRDVKPGNIIVADDATPYLTDFGLARIASQGESSLSVGMIVGTPHYLSPEQASGDYEIGAGADVYALGVMLYEMVVGRVPFSAETPHAIVHNHIYNAPPPPTEINPEVPEDVAQVLLKALEKDPADRYPTPDTLMSAFKLAVRQSGLTELRDDRSEIAAQSMARLNNHVPPRAPQTPPPQQVVAELDLGEVGRGIVSSVREGFGWGTGADRAPSSTSTRIYEPPTDEAVASQLRQRAERRVRAQRRWRTHLIVFLVVNILLLVGGGISSDLAAASIEAEIANIQSAEPGAFSPVRSEAARALQIAETEIGLVAVQQPWGLAITTLWLGILLAHRAYVNARSVRVGRKRQRALDRALVRHHGENWSGTVTEQEYAAVEQAVERRYCRRQAFWSHFWVFLLGNMALGRFWEMSGAVLNEVSEFVSLQGDPQAAEFLQTLAATPVFAGITLAWFVVLLVHGGRAFFGRTDDAIEREYQRELETSGLLQAEPDKRKHTLSDESPVPAVRMNADGELTNSTVEAWGSEGGRRS